MAFVTCGQFKQSQEEQDNRLDKLETCCSENQKKIDEVLKHSNHQEQQIRDDMTALQQEMSQKNNKQDTLLGELAQCCESNNAKNEEQGNQITALDNRLKNLASENNRLNAENNSLRSQLAAANGEIASLRSQLAECKASGVGNLSLAQQGKLLFNASWTNRKTEGDWETATLRIDEVQGNNKGDIEYIKVHSRFTDNTTKGTTWLNAPNQDRTIQPYYVNDSDFAGQFSNGLGRKEAWIPGVPIRPMTNSGDYTAAYFNILVKYKDDPNEYPAGDVLDYVLAGYNNLPEAEQNAVLARPF